MSETKLEWTELASVAKKAARLAEFSGHCQGCGRDQMLPTGKLSNHGYTVQWNMFHGTCGGAGRLPYEKSCDYCKQCITAASESIKSLTEKLTLLAQPVIDPTAEQVTVYVSAKDKYSVGRERTFYDVTFHLDPEYGNFKRPMIMFTTPQGETYPYSDNLKTPLDAAKQCRTYEIRRTQERIKALTDYVKWQEERVANWKPGTLAPIIRDPSQQPLKPQDIKLLKTVAEETGDGSTYTINDRSTYYFKQTVTYNRLKKLVDRGLVTMVQQGHNKDGNFLTVKISEAGLAEIA